MLRMAARVGYTFKIDPREVLRSSYYERALLAAAHNVARSELRQPPPGSQQRGR